VKKLEGMHQSLMLDYWINNTNINPADIPYPNAIWMEYGCYTYEKELNPKPDRIYDRYWFEFRRSGEGHPHLKFDENERTSPYFVFREEVKPNSNWYELIEVASKLHIRSRDWQHHGFSGFEPHKQYDDLITLHLNS